MIDLTHLAQLDVNPVHLVRALRRAGLRPSPPSGYGEAGLRLVLGDRDGSVIVSQCEVDGADWIHASISWRDHMPSYGDLVTLKKGVFVDREAYQVFPPKARHVNIHAYALHLWGRADGARVLPDFGVEGTI